jgi:hypothetical protein
MLTRTIHVNGTTIDPAEAIHSTGLDTVPDRVDAAISAAGDSLREAGDSLRATVHQLSAPPSRTRMPSTRGWLAGIAFLVAAVAVSTWLFRRMSSAPVADDDLDTLDLEDLERAKGEGMGTAVGSAVSSDPLHVPSDSESDNELMGVMAEPAAIGERNGIGVASSDRYSS